ncbi:MAG: YebC/PmpR family DNA-binding transcriptional regulator [Tenericutes bacterium]|nr:YebC/PmpR family DNA-binding transcriptional regulator [Mycoplasmatota bacterium]
MGRAHEVRAAKMGKTAMKKSKLYSRFGKELYIAAKTGGTDPNSNLKLKRLIEKAKHAQVPGDVIKRNIEKANSSAGEDYSSAVYEGFGPGGCTIIVDCLTDNHNRTFGEVRTCFTKTGGKLGISGSVSYLYTYCSHVSFTGMSEDDALEILMNNDCEITDIESDDDLVIITGEPGDLDHIIKALSSTDKEIDFIEDHVTYVPSNTVKLDEDHLLKFTRFLDLCNDLDDVQEIYHNVEL